MNLNLEGYYNSEIYFKKGSSYTKNEPECDWYDVTLNIKSKYFNYNETHESLLESELRYIYNTFNKCLNNKLEQDEDMTFLEPDLEIHVYKSSDDKDYHLCEFKICIYLNELGSTGDYYSILMDDREMIMIRDYIGEILNIKPMTNN